MRKKLTAKSIETVKCEGPHRLEVYDLNLPAFGLRVSYSGVKTWFCVKRINNRVRRSSLGKYPAISLSKAHDAARRVLQEADHQPEVDHQTLGQIAPRFLARHAKPKNRNWRETERLLNQKFQ
jgi:Arm DNA-binding domain